MTVVVRAHSHQPFTIERRQQLQPGDPHELLHHLPARVLLERTPIPTIGVDRHARLVYANPACVAMLGYPDSDALLGRPLPALLAGHTFATAQDCITVLCSGATTFVNWCHAEGFAVQTTVSTPLLLRSSDPLLLIHLNDITELVWERARDENA